MRARITSFDPADGLGNVELEDGRVVRFGFSSCKAVPPLPGLEVDVPEIVPGFRGALRASALLPVVDLATLPWSTGVVTAYDPARKQGTITLGDGRVAELSPMAEMKQLRLRAALAVKARVAGTAVVSVCALHKPVSLAKALARLQAAGFGTSIKPADLKREIAEVYDGDAASAELHVVVDSWYSAHPSEAKRDGWIGHDWRWGNEVEDPLAELAEVSGHALTAARPTDDAYSAYVTAFNQALAAAGVTKRFLGLDTQGDNYIYLFIEPEVARTLADDGILPFESR